jgi:hypothetical protein
MPDATANSNKDNAELNKKIASLYSYLAIKLGITELPKVAISHDENEPKKEFGKTAYYDPSNKSIKLYVFSRHNTDILRSFAHEVIHHWQNLNGTLNPEGTAAQCASYAQVDPNLRKREMEAYLFGNILFRDWQDENRYGPPAHPPLMPELIKENRKTRVVCKGCKKSCDYAEEPEIAMGSIRCPHCKKIMDQTGENYAG